MHRHTLGYILHKLTKRRQPKAIQLCNISDRKHPRIKKQNYRNQPIHTTVRKSQQSKRQPGNQNPQNSRRKPKNQRKNQKSKRRTNSTWRTFKRIKPKFVDVKS